jgi:hypothetical protein
MENPLKNCQNSGPKRIFQRLLVPRLDGADLGNRVKGKREWPEAAARRPAGNSAILRDWGYIYCNQ